MSTVYNNLAPTGDNVRISQARDGFQAQCCDNSRWCICDACMAGIHPIEVAYPGSKSDDGICTHGSLLSLRDERDVADLLARTETAVAS